MNKKIILSTIAATSIFALFANATSVEDRLIQLEKIIQAQQLEINKLKNTAKDVDKFKSTASDVEELDERLGVIETRSYTDKIQLGLGMRVEANNISTKYANGTTPVNEEPLFRTKLNDINTGYKVFETKTLKELGIQTRRFEVCEELTIKALRRNLKIVEVPISYYPRTFKEGKKIRVIDGLKAILAIFYFLRGN